MTFDDVLYERFRRLNDQLHREEIRIGRKIIRKGIVRDLKDPARMVNFSYSETVQTLALQTVDGVAADVRQPLLVDAFIDARQHPHDLGPLGVGADVRS